MALDLHTLTVGTHGSKTGVDKLCNTLLVIYTHSWHQIKGRWAP